MVSGAGPVGSLAAIFLAAQGWNVKVRSCFCQAESGSGQGIRCCCFIDDIRGKFEKSMNHRPSAIKNSLVA